MDFFDLVDRRCCVRSFDPATPVPPAVVDRLLHAAIRSPSGGNRQPWQFVVVRNAALREELCDAAHGQEFVAQAPVVIVVCAQPEQSGGKYGERGRTLYCLQDTACATLAMLYAAVDLGYASCWVGAFDESAVSRALGLSAELRPVAMLPVGKAAELIEGQTSRRPVGEVVRYLD